MSEATVVHEPPTSRRPRNPYVGPRPFRSQEQFFGRGREASNLVNTLVSSRVVLLHSPSGAGKTSLIQAAVLPAFVDRDFQLCAASSHHISALRVNLPAPTDIGDANRYVYSVVNGMVGHLVERSEAVRMRIGEACQLLATQTEATRQLLVLDQLEEILTLDPADLAGQKEFFRQLGEALDDDHRWGLLAMREDYLGGLDRFRRYLPGQLRSTFRLDLLERRPALSAAQRPAAAAGVDFTDEAAELLVDGLRHVKANGRDASTSVAASPYIEPVLLQVVCDSLWRKVSAREGQLRTITKADVEGFRPFNVALSDYYRHVVREAARRDPDRERRIRDWLDRHLVSSQGLRRPTRSVPEVDDPDAVLRALQDRYLIRDDPRPGGTWWELSHDLLVPAVQEDNRTWRKNNLAAWEVMADQWQRSGRDRRFLLGPADLRTAMQLSRRSGTSEIEHQFLDESRRAVTATGRLARLEQLNSAYSLALVLSVVLNLVLIVLLVR